MNHKFYSGKTVLITGHTGFKGSWLTLWLIELGAKVIGISDKSEFEKGIFELAKLKDKIVDVRTDVRDLKVMQAIFTEHNPDVVFHLAAQAIVRESYDIPVETFETNVMGTVNILECTRTSKSVKSVVIVTSDKCYKNKEWTHGYRENDELGGSDPYSASKSCAEIVVESYRKSFFEKSKARIASVRAGNVIGGGDWAKDRIVPDCIKALISKKSIPVRNPDGVRPWQHVLEPLNGYLTIGAKLVEDEKYSGAWNFGPDYDSIINVGKLVELMIEKWGSGKCDNLKDPNEPKKETTLLNLDSSKSRFRLNWKPLLNISETIEMVVEWYKKYDKEDVYELCCKQIKDFSKNA